MRSFRVLLIQNLKVYFRNFRATFWSFIFPMVMLAILMAAFGRTEGQGYLSPVDLEIDHRDTSEMGHRLVDTIGLALSSVSGLTVNYFPTEAAPTRQGSGLRLVIPAGFSENRTAHPSRAGVALYYQSPLTESEKIVASIIAAVYDRLWLERLTAQPPLPVIPLGALETEGSNDSLSYGQFLSVGLVAMTVLSIGLFGFCVPLALMRENRLNQMLSLFPLSPTVFILAFITSTTMILAGFAVWFMLTANYLYALQIPVLSMVWWRFLVLVLLAVCFFVAVGLALVGIIHSAAAVSGVANMIFFPLILGSDLIIPARYFPDLLQVITRHFPLTAIAASMREVLYQNSALTAQSGTIWLCLIWLVPLLILVKATFRFQRPI
jgi:ABC-2 type transport system permease protein